MRNKKQLIDLEAETKKLLRLSGIKGISPRTLATIRKTEEIISQYDTPLTVRQVYYRFVGEQLIENNIRSYKRIANILAKARETGFIPYDRIVDRTRQAIKQSSWSSPKSFFETVKGAYRKKILEDQSQYIEVWVEKDALAGLFEPITSKFDITLVVGRGYPSHSALYEASKRFNKHSSKDLYILYFGDFDPSGEDIFRDVQSRMFNLFSVDADFKKVSLTLEDIETYKLPPAPTKKTDSRSQGFISEYGDLSIELDALPPDILSQKIENSILKHLDRKKLERNLTLEQEEIAQIQRVVEKL